MAQNALEKLTEKYGRCEADQAGSGQYETDQTGYVQRKADQAEYGWCEEQAAGQAAIQAAGQALIPEQWQTSKSVPALQQSADSMPSIQPGDSLHGSSQKSIPGASQGVTILTDWKQSESVRELSSFLKNNDHGFYLKQTKDGFLVVHFEPGLKQESHDPDRWTAAIHTLDLLEAAREDLKQLISNGALSLPIYKGILK